MVEQKSTILIVDDEPIARDVLAGYLFQEEYNLTFAASGVEALEQLDQVRPDVVLLDIMMPDLDGFSVCRQIKADNRWQHIPVIIVTAMGEKKDMIRGLEAGADDFLHKPVDPLELKARVHSMLRIKKQYDELRQLLQLREDLARMVVHDMRNPLSVILGYSELLENENPDLSEVIVTRLRHIRSQTRRLSSFMNDLMLSAKLESNQLILHRSQVDASHLVQEAVENYNIIAQARKIALATELPLQAQQAILDENLFVRVLDNLLSNALKFSPPGSTVTVQQENLAAGSSPSLRLKVIDEGPGIAPDHRERIFDKYEVVSLKQEGVHQIGLGLAFCKLVVEAHGGRIFVDDNQPTGSIFTVEI